MLQEVKEARQRYETRLVEVDSGRKEEYEYKLTEALTDMRAQNEEQIKLARELHAQNIARSRKTGSTDHLSAADAATTASQISAIDAMHAQVRVQEGQPAHTSPVVAGGPGAQKMR